VERRQKLDESIKERRTEGKRYLEYLQKALKAKNECKLIQTHSKQIAASSVRKTVGGTM
jgi:hypothetical protein